MKIWKLKSDVDKYDNLEPVKDFSVEEYWRFDGHELKWGWIPLEVQRMEPEKKLPLSDTPGFTIPVFSKRALEVLQPYLQDSAEILELVFDEGDYYGINVIAVLDVVDYEKAKYINFNNSNRIMVFTKYAFKECDELKRHHIFKIVDVRRTVVFVSEEFKEAVEKNKLTGFEFELAWDSEQDD
ncbi:MAG: hypothetical protein NC331_04725 [Lachnospiraceae bacterium]|nr:hypothetical protein [Lachnospiraceae bacterium]MCM1238668.1 hypothetical protein [Lachnospiraceae bacterium]